jgi:hypothetical protein
LLVYPHLMNCDQFAHFPHVAVRTVVVCVRIDTVIFLHADTFTKYLPVHTVDTVIMLTFGELRTYEGSTPKPVFIEVVNRL